MLTRQIAAIQQRFAQNPGAELEAKFSYYAAHSVKYEAYERVLNYLSREVGNEVLEQSHVFSRDGIRKIVYDGVDDAPDTVKWQRKDLLANFDFPEYNIRVSLNNETELTPAQIPTTFTGTTVRDRSRRSYTLPDTFNRVDLTEVMMQAEDGVARPVYEIELEYLGPPDQLGTFEAAVTLLFKILHGTHVVYTTEMKNSMLAAVGPVLGNRGAEISKEILVEARNIKHRDLVWGGIVGNRETGYQPNRFGTVTTQPPTRYVVTFKADGFRKLLIVHRTGIWLVYPPFEFNLVIGRVGGFVKFLDDFDRTVLDGELVIPKHTNNILHYYLGFDCLAVKGSASIQQKNYFERAQLVAAVAKIMKTPTLTIDTKKTRELTTPAVFFEAVAEFLNEREALPYPEDGLMFIPADVQYNFGSQLLPLSHRSLTVVPDICKWKEQRNITIDFALGWTPDGRLDLLSYDTSKKELVKFVGDVINPLTPAMIDYQSELTAGKPGLTVFEYEWFQGKLVPRRPRYDKKGTPNRLEIALDNWEDIHNPITEDEITGRSLKMTFSYHNRIKKALFAFLPRGANILDIGSGKGGDVSRWMSLGGLVVAVEPNETNRAELVERIATFDMTDRVKVVPTGGEDTVAITEAVQAFIPGGQVDAVALMLSMSFFWSSSAHLDALITTIVTNLKPGGTIIFLTINGDAVQQLFEPAFSPERRTSITLADAKLDLNPPSPPPYGRGLDVEMRGTIVDQQHEYLVHIHDLTQRLAPHGIVLTEQWRAEGEPLLSHDNAVFSSLYAYGYYTDTGTVPRSQAPVTNIPLLAPPLQMEPVPPLPIPIVAIPPPPVAIPPIPPVGTVLRRENEQLAWLPVSYTGRGGRVVAGPAINDDTYAPLTCTWYPNLVRIATIGEGSCFLHAVLKGYNKQYQEDNKATFRLGYVANLRRDLAIELGRLNPLYPEHTYWATSGNGAFVGVAMEEVIHENLVEILGVDYSLSGLQRLLNSTHTLGDEVYKFISDALNVDVYVLRATRTDLFPHYHTHRPAVVRDGIVIIGNMYHYETLAVSSEQGFQTVFPPGDPFLAALSEVFVGDGAFNDIVNNIPFDPDENFITSTVGRIVGWYNDEFRVQDPAVVQQALADFDAKVTEIFSETDPLRYTYSRLRDQIAQRVQLVVLDPAAAPLTPVDADEDELDRVLVVLERSGVPVETRDKIRAVVAAHNDPQVEQNLERLITIAFEEGLVTQDMADMVVTALAVIRG